MISANEDHVGLTSDEVKKLQQQYGKNQIISKRKKNFLFKVIHIFCEPMFLLLLSASIIYCILGELLDGIIMLVFVFCMIAIEMIQEWKTEKTLNALKELSAPHISVIRDGLEIIVASEDLVPNDVMIINEGVKIPADGEIIKCNDLCVDESSLTGESTCVWKVAINNLEASNEYWRKDYCYAGTLVIQGTAHVLVDKIGAQTEYGKIGTSIATAPETPSPLQKQIGDLVKLCAGIAAVLFIAVSFITWFNISNYTFGDRLVESILSGITLAMAMIPEEFPVIFIVFLSMGAWRLAKKQSLVRKLSTVETLGAVSVLCVDKTGTITMNQMTVCETWALNDDIINLCHTMGLGCETNAYDPMEKAMLAHCESIGITKQHLFEGKLIKEYSFSNQLKMMGHIWHHDEKIIIAAKGSPEQILMICNLTNTEKIQIEEKIIKMAKQGLRVIAVGKMYPISESEIPTSIMDCTLTFCGLIGLYDPPRESIKEDVRRCTQAGVRMVMITGDNGITAKAIAKQIGMPNNEQIITSEDLNNMSDEALRDFVKSVNIFSRVIPEHKKRIIKALKENGEIVAMTGDGVNDAPALKFADIGIAMGKRGSEVSREAADMVLIDDNFSTIVDTIKDGRRIYDNIRKAVGYVFIIHIPIALAALLAPLLDINPINLFLLPIHVVLLELIIDPTCSVVLERQPAEQDIMHRKPRDPKEKILNSNTLLKSIFQGLAIFIASFGTYYLFLHNNPNNAALARSMGLSIIMLANLFLVQVNSSSTNFVFQTFKYLMKDKVMWAVNIITIIGLIIILYTPLAKFLKTTSLTISQLLLCLLVAFASVIWIEIIKLLKLVWKKCNH